ncbi:hypothetical protein LSH36_241g06000 [Paralvinella palmiformis]|uniref:Uncharacterized protein n=1 Tax=Paralvinella palmiformis TaxID=53620 RepID=A0AAD9JLR5_9ANNE|nr:hypothetical protein LSH36_241g06000 [Paralvinella palmiformis]
MRLQYGNGGVLAMGLLCGNECRLNIRRNVVICVYGVQQVLQANICSHITHVSSHVSSPSLLVYSKRFTNTPHICYCIASIYYQYTPSTFPQQAKHDATVEQTWYHRTTNM